MTLNEAIAEGFSYKRRAARGTQTPDETIAKQQGTCRDFALLIMEAARSLGFAARFVTGYVYVPERDGPQRLGVARPMRGVKFTSPDPAGVEFDPTNGIVGNRDLIRVELPGRPNRRFPCPSYWGEADEELAMEVTVNVKTEDSCRGRFLGDCRGRMELFGFSALGS